MQQLTSSLSPSAAAGLMYLSTAMSCLSENNSTASQLLVELCTEVCIHLFCSSLGRSFLVAVG